MDGDEVGVAWMDLAAELCPHPFRCRVESCGIATSHHTIDLVAQLLAPCISLLPTEGCIVRHNAAAEVREQPDQLV